MLAELALYLSLSDAFDYIVVYANCIVLYAIFDKCRIFFEVSGKDLKLAL